MASISQLAVAMTTLYSGDPARIATFMKIYAFAKMIAEEEEIGTKQREIIEATALVWNIGIRTAEKKYRKVKDEHIGLENPPIARTMLMALDFSPALINRVCENVALYRCYDRISGMDQQIISEADYMVRAAEEKLPRHTIRAFRDKVFRTQTGRLCLNEIYGLEEDRG